MFITVVVSSKINNFFLVPHEIESLYSCIF